MRLPLLYVGLLAGVLGFTVNPSGGFGLPVAHAESQGVRPEVGKPLLAAQDLMKAKKFQEALAKIREADAIGNKTPQETFTIEQMRGIAALSSGDVDTAANAFDVVINSGKANPADQLKFAQAVSGGYYQKKEYAKAINWAQRYFKLGGTDSSMRTLMIQAQFLTGDYSGAAKALNSEFEANEKEGTTPSEERLTLLANCYLKMNDNNGYAKVLERLVTYHPKKEYWADLLSRIQRKPGGSDRVSLDIFRLKQATGNLKDAADYMEMTQLAMQAGYPAEAKKVIDEGFSKGLLGTGADAERQKKLRDFTAKQAADDQKTLAKSEASAKEGDALVNLGYAYVANGDYEKGISLMEQGIAKGGLKRPEDAKLHLGLAYLKAGEKAKAIKTFKSVQGNDQVADLARLWIIQTNRAAT